MTLHRVELNFDAPRSHGRPIASIDGVGLAEDNELLGTVRHAYEANGPQPLR